MLTKPRFSGVHWGPLARGKQMRPITPYNNRVTTTGGPVAHELIGLIGALFMAPKIFVWGA
jgi:hypothetical protein